jgi:formamidopyrimidine-DNA glycosylase
MAEPHRVPPVVSGPEHLLQTHRIATTSRKGKQLAVHAAEGPILLLQLGMSGEVRICKPLASPNPDSSVADLSLERCPPHTHALWHLDNGTVIQFIDPRRFGHLTWFPSLAALHRHRWDHLGPDALSIAPAALAEALRSTMRSIKAALLDQSILAGVGNIYADEALHLARLHPKRPAHRLSGTEIDRLAHAIAATLDAAVRAGGSTISTYRSPSGSPGNHQVAHRVYARGDEPCLTCATPLKSQTVAQRTTVWCPTCQPYRPRRPAPVVPQPTIHTRFTSGVESSLSPGPSNKSSPIPRRVCAS